MREGDRKKERDRERGEIERKIINLHLKIIVNMQFYMNLQP